MRRSLYLVFVALLLAGLTLVVWISDFVADRYMAFQLDLARPTYQAKARLIAPELDESDLDLLSSDEIRTDAFEPRLSPRPFPKHRSLTDKVIDAHGPYSRYVGSDGREVEPFSALPPPEITVEETVEYPVVSMPKRFDQSGREAIYYFEFDTSPTFDTPNFWRYPALTVVEYSPNLTGRRGLKFHLLRTPHRQVDGHSNRVSFPFRASAMRLPGWNELSFAQLERHARALGYGLEPHDTIREVFSYVRQVYSWASDTESRSPIDTFAAGLGECGHVNDLAGAILEMNGIRYRLVSGFAPKARALLNGNGGHSAIEVLNPRSGKWSYVDSYLDLFLIDVQARDLKQSTVGDTIVYRIPPGLASPLYDSDITLVELFSFRKYGDKLGRLEMASMLRLHGKSDEYGTQWPLNQAPRFTWKQLFPDEIRIYVRGRYAFVGDAKMQQVSVSTPTTNEIRISPWTTVSFVVHPQ